MGTITEKSRSLSVTADYTNEDVRLNISLNYRKDALTDALVNMEGQVYTSDTNEYIGSFTGGMRNGKMQYSFSGIEDLSRLSDLVACIQDIEEQISK